MESPPLLHREWKVSLGYVKHCLGEEGEGKERKKGSKLSALLIMRMKNIASGIAAGNLWSSCFQMLISGQHEPPLLRKVSRAAQRGEKKPSQSQPPSGDQGTVGRVV